MAPPLAEDAQRVQDRFEIPVLIAALAVIPVVLIEEQAGSRAWLDAAQVANWVIWLVFAAEYLTVVRLADDRWAYTKTAWLSVVIIVVSFPVLPALLASTRLLRLARLGRVFRLLRLVRLAAVLGRGGTALRRIFGRAGLGYVVGVTVLLALGFGTLLAMAEESVDTPFDGVWWAFVTLTTVGYGDIAPVSTVGRVLALALMAVGIGLVAVITAAVAARFVEEDEADLAAEVERLHERLHSIETMLEALSGDQRGGPTGVRDDPRSRRPHR